MKPKTTPKIYRILALAAAVVLAGLYIATLCWQSPAMKTP